jgi:hypothetical protein
MKNLHILSFTLVLIGAINWGLVGLLDVNLVTMLFGGSTTLVNAIYILVGASGLYLVFTHKGDCMICSKM